MEDETEQNAEMIVAPEALPVETLPTEAAGGDAPEPPPVTSPAADLVERWWNDNFPGSPVARVTEAWNHAYAAKEELKRLLRAI